MNRTTRDPRRGERGQVLVLAALVLTAVLGGLALVVDVGNALAQRRLMQNAADAAAVAAVRQMANSLQSGTSDAAVLGAINSYLDSNGKASTVGGGSPSVAWYTKLDGTRVRQISSGSLPGADATDVRGVEVQAAKPVDTYFAKVFGYKTITVQANGSANYASVSSLLVNWKLTGVPLLPLAFDIDAFHNGTTSCNGFGGFGPSHPFTYSDYVDIPSDCALGTADMHFSYSTLNVGDNCSNSTIKTQFDNLINNPESFGNTSIIVDAGGNGTPIHVCHGSRLANPDLVVGVGRPIAVPLIAHVDAAACDPQCVARVIGIGVVRLTASTDTGSNQYFSGYWVDPRTMPAVPKQRLGSTSTINGPVTFNLTR
jgi:Flp pilus assembly protein TadG